MRVNIDIPWKSMEIFKLTKYREMSIFFENHR